MKLLVTGVEGYIGCLLAPLLQARGHDVVGMDTGYYRDGWLFSDRGLVPPVFRAPSTATSARSRPQTCKASMPSCTWRSCRTTRSARTTPS